jgi:hypothetical protein
VQVVCVSVKAPERDQGGNGTVCSNDGLVAIALNHVARAGRSSRQGQMGCRGINREATRLAQPEPPQSTHTLASEIAVNCVGSNSQAKLPPIQWVLDRMRTTIMHRHPRLAE